MICVSLKVILPTIDTVQNGVALVVRLERSSAYSLCFLFFLFEETEGNRAFHCYCLKINECTEAGGFGSFYLYIKAISIWYKACCEISSYCSTFVKKKKKPLLRSLKSFMSQNFQKGQKSNTLCYYK